MSFIRSVIRATLSTIVVGICQLMLGGCSSSKAAPAAPPAVVEVATVIQQDTPIYSEWVAVLDGCVNAQIYRSLGGGWQQ